MLDLSAGLLLFTCFFTVTDESAWCDRRLARADDCQAPNTGGVIASPSLAIHHRSILLYLPPITSINLLAIRVYSPWLPTLSSHSRPASAT